MKTNRSIDANLYICVTASHKAAQIWVDMCDFVTQYLFSNI